MSTLAPPDAVRPAALAPRGPAERSAPPPAFAAKGAVVLALRVGALGLSVGTSVLLARLLGPSGLGVYETAMGWAALLGVPAGAGAEKLVVREVAAARATGRWGTARGLARASAFAVLAASALVALAAGLAQLVVDVPIGLGLVAAGVVPLAALLRVRQAVLQGLGNVVGGQVPELVVAPATFLLLLGAALLASGHASPTTALACQVGAFAAALAVAALSLRRAAPGELRAAAADYALAGWARATLPLCALAGLQVLNARVDVVMLGALADPAEVGRYASASRAAALIAMPLLAANAALGPAIARLHALGDRAGLQAAVSRSALLTLAASVPIALVMLLGGGLVLAVFGPGFLAARDVLTVLATAQVVNVAMGSVGLILLMTGHVRTAVLGLAVSAALNVGLDLALIPSHGALGAAIAAGSSLVVWNVLLAVGVRRRLGLRPSALGGVR